MQNDIQVFQQTPLEAITRSECDIQISTAKRYPRDPKKALQNAIEAATMSVKTAKDCLYFRPVGSRNGKMNYASGLSIRGAEAMYTCWGNLRIGAAVVGEEGGVISVRGTCHDLESNVLLSKESSKAVGKAGANQKAVMMDALSSLAIRGAVERTIPGGYITVFLDSVFAKIVGSSPEEVKSTFEKTVAFFETLKYSKKDVLDLVEAISSDKVTAENAAFLVGLINAIKDGITTATEAFGFEGKFIATDQKEKKKAAEQTPGQKFALLQVQLLKTDIGKEIFGKTISSFVEKFAKDVEEFSPEQFAEINAALEAGLKSVK